MQVSATGAENASGFVGEARFRFPPDDFLSYSNDQLLELMCLFLAGRAAEEVGSMGGVHTCSSMTSLC
jgi:hypothetical protein